MTTSSIGDLVVLTADKDAHFGVEGLLSRPERFGVRRLDEVKYLEAGGDGDCRTYAPDLLRPFVGKYEYALVLFDWEGCGMDTAKRHKKAVSPQIVESEVKTRLEQNGWKDHAEVVILVPELEIWMWNSSPKLDEIVGWQNHIPDLRTWVRQQPEFLMRGDLPNKPERPKEALLAALREAREPPSASLFHQMGARVGKTHLDRSREPAFAKFKTTLQRWFPLEA